MTFNVQKGPFKFQKVSLYRVRGDILLSHPPPPRLVASLPHFVPPPQVKTNPGRASASRLLSEPWKYT